MSPKSIEQEDVSKLENILNAAQIRFGQYGLAKTTMTEIAADIGLSKAALYYYYPDKESLFEAVIKKEQKEFINEMNNLIKPNSKASSLLALYVKKRQDLFLKFMNLGKLKYDSLISTKPLLCRLSENLIQKENKVVHTILEIGISNKEFRKININEYSDFLVQVMQGLRLYAKKMQAGIIMTEEELNNLNDNQKKAMNMFIKDISV
jgi:TetR/AcrR family transcriptional regulator